MHIPPLPWMTLVKCFIYISFLFSRVLDNRLSTNLKIVPMLNMANRFIQKCVIQPMNVLNKKFMFDGHQNQSSRLNLFGFETFRNFSSETNGTNIPVVGYNEVKNLPNSPDITLIDVREPNELQETGSIPTSLNIPCEKMSMFLNFIEMNEFHGFFSFSISSVGDIPAALSLSDKQFKTKYQRNKPDFSDEIIFHCKAGIRSENAAIAAIKLGYTK